MGVGKRDRAVADLWSTIIQRLDRDSPRQTASLIEKMTVWNRPLGTNVAGATRAALQGAAEVCGEGRTFRAENARVQASGGLWCDCGGVWVVTT